MTYEINKNTRWWQLDKGSRHEGVFGAVRHLINTSAWRTDRNLRNMRLYGSSKFFGFSGGEYVHEHMDFEERLSLNVIKSVIDAATSKISSNRPRAQFLTEGGKWGLQEQAKKLTQFVDGQFWACDVYKKTRKVFRDACIFGNGPVHVYTDWSDPENPTPTVERVFPEELWFDPVDAKYGRPRQIYRVKTIGREVLAGDPEYKKKMTQIKGAGLIREEESGFESLADPVTVIEAIHLPSSPSAKDGWRVLCVDTGELSAVEYKRKKFPFPMMHWTEPVLGSEGIGLGDELQGIQVEINKILRKVQQHMHLASSFILANRGSKILKSHLTNTPWSLLEYTGDAPTFATIQSISPEYFAQIDRLYANAFEIAGITQLFSTGKKPSGLDSGKALREYKDTESQRFMATGQAWEEFHLEISECLIEEAKEIDETLKATGKTDGYTVLAKNEAGDGLDRLKWEDVNLDRDKYVMQQYPTSALPKLPAFRMEQVKEMLDVEPRLQNRALELLAFPDLKAATKQINAPIDEIEQVTDRMLYAEGDMYDLYTPPDSFTKLGPAMNITKNKYIRARMDGCPEERLELLLRYMSEVEELMKPPEPPQIEGPMPGEGLPTGLPPAPAPGMGPASPPGMGDVNISPRINVQGPEAMPPIPGQR